MLVIDFTKKRIKSFLQEIKYQIGIDYPFNQSKEALLELYDLFNFELGKIEKLDEHNNHQLIYHACEQVLAKIDECSPRLGCIRNSSDERNAFEVYRPLWRLACDLLEPNNKNPRTKLILYSEWSYNAIIYNEYIHLPGYLLIGLPAWESSNPLLIPLAGHELGHAAWRTYSLHLQIEEDLWKTMMDILNKEFDKYKNLFDVSNFNDLSSNLIATQIINEALIFSKSQTEEIFCDCIGVYIFRESYLYSFAYMLSPRMSTYRSEYYPRLKNRINNLVQYSSQLGVEIPESYQKMFNDEEDYPGILPEKELLLELADTTTSNSISVIYELAESLIKKSNIIKSSTDEIKRIKNFFKKKIPPDNIVCLADIINAAWQVYIDENFWVNEFIDNENKGRILKELALKTIELFEVQKIIEE